MNFLINPKVVLVLCGLLLLPAATLSLSLTNPLTWLVQNVGFTEPRFSSLYNYQSPSAGAYKCKRCGAMLYDAADKYDSGSGWPSFTAGQESVQKMERDYTGRFEVKCKTCDAHLGHVFPDGPKVEQGGTGWRHCVNGAVLKYEEGEGDDGGGDGGDALTVRGGSTRALDLRFGVPFGGSAFFVFLDAAGKGSLGATSKKVGDVVFASQDLPSLSIVQHQGYELVRVYFKGLDSQGAVVEIDVDDVDGSKPESMTDASKYLVLYSPVYHDDLGPVTVAEEELVVVTLREEALGSAWLAVPGLFWVFVATRFYEYGVATGRM